MRHLAFYSSLILLPSFLHAQTPTAVKAVLEGDVVNATTNAPVAGARVRLNSAQKDPIYGKSDQQGHFVLANLAPGIYQLSVDSPGLLQSNRTMVDLTAPRAGRTSPVTRTSGPRYPPSKIPDATLAKSSDEDGTVRVKATVPMLAYAVITGVVTDPYGMPLVNATVEVLTSRPPPPPNIPAGSPLQGVPVGNSVIARYWSVGANDRGEFRVSRLEPGTYWVAVNRGGGGTWESSYRSTYFPAAIRLADAKPFELVAGQVARADIRIVRQAGVRVAGRVINPSGEAAQPNSLYTGVSLLPVENPLLNVNGPFARGRDTYQVADVLPGKYTLMAVTRDAASNPIDWEQKPLFGLVREIEVGDRDTDGIDLTLAPLRDLPGEAVFGEGCKPTATEIRIMPVGYNPLGRADITATSGPDGRFTLSNIVTGRFRVSVTLPAPQGNIRVGSIRLGDRDVLKDGLEIPYQGNDSLRIGIECGTVGRQQ